MPRGAWFAYAPGIHPGGPAGADEPGYSSRQLSRGLPSGPDPGRRPEVADVGRLARRGLMAAVHAARADERPGLSDLVTAHLGTACADAEVSTQRWARHDGVNMQRALDAWLAEPGREHRSFGVPVGYDVGLAEFVAGSNALLMSDLEPAAVGRINLPCGPGQVQACASAVIHLVMDAGRRVVFYARLGDPRHGVEHCTVEMVSDDPGAGEQISGELRELSKRLNVYRGHVLSIGQDAFDPGEGLLQFCERPALTRDQLVLEDDAFEAIERQVVGVARHRDALLAGGQHLKRGVLLYGPPGVGKTHTVRYLTACLAGTTVITLSGQALGLIGFASSVARSLQPALVVVEDVDLIAEDRGMHPGEHPMLFELLNEMDGLEGDADVCFVLTTNRPDVLEPALAARPGRVDQAIEIVLPDLAARRRLFDLYLGSLPLAASPDRVQATLARAEGVTASFLKELARRAALFALERPGASRPDDGAQRRAAARYGGTAEVDELVSGMPAAAKNRLLVTVDGDDLDAALDDLLATRNAMTRRLLGGDDRPSGMPAE